MRVALFGGSGFLGRGIATRMVARGHRPLVVSRTDPGMPSVDFAAWDGCTLGPWTEALGDVTHVVHLAGKRVDCRPTASNLAELIRSREDTVRLAGAGFAEIGVVPDVWVQLSSLARYGDVPEGTVDESTRLPLDGIPQHVEVCRRWEAAYRDVTAEIHRRVLLRPGIAIGGLDDPATAQLIRLVRLGLGGTVGSGSQWVSWIAAEDLFAVMLRALDHDSMGGIYNVTAPTPVTNRELMAAYRRALGRRFGLPSPAWVTRIGARLLGSDPNLILTGRAGVPTRLLDEGFTFTTPDIDDAITAAVAEAGIVRA